MYNDLFLNFFGLNQLITKLDQDKRNIEQTIKEMNIIFISIDNTKWKSCKKD